MTDHALNNRLVAIFVDQCLEQIGAVSGEDFISLSTVVEILNGTLALLSEGPSRLDLFDELNKERAVDLVHNAEPSAEEQLAEIRTALRLYLNPRSESMRQSALEVLKLESQIR